jgi:hypothetical protein
VGRPGVDLGEAVQDRRHPMPRALGLGSGREAVQHEDFGRRQKRAERERLVEVRDEELSAPLGCECRRDDRRAEAIGVGLDDRGTSGDAETAAEHTVVGANGAKVDSEHRACVAGSDDGTHEVILHFVVRARERRLASGTACRPRRSRSTTSRSFLPRPLAFTPESRADGY